MFKGIKGSVREDLELDIFIYIKKEFLVLVFFSAMDLLHLIFIVRLVN